VWDCFRFEKRDLGDLAGERGDSVGFEGASELGVGTKNAVYGVLVFPLASISL
jgi:hypothetical protein